MGLCAFVIRRGHSVFESKWICFIILLWFWFDLKWRLKDVKVCSHQIIFVPTTMMMTSLLRRLSGGRRQSVGRPLTGTLRQRWRKFGGGAGGAEEGEEVLRLDEGLRQRRRRQLRVDVELSVTTEDSVNRGVVVGRRVRVFVDLAGTAVRYAVDAVARWQAPGPANSVRCVCQRQWLSITGSLATDDVTVRTVDVLHYGVV